MNLETQKSPLIVGISDMKLAQGPLGVVVTFALGSCLGVSVYDPITQIGGIIHCLLPLSSMSPEKAKENPFTFVDTGVPIFLNQFIKMGGDLTSAIVKVAGCGHMLDMKHHFNVGQRNHTVLRKILWKNDILISGELIGGTDAKTLSLDLETGTVTVKTMSGLVEI